MNAILRITNGTLTVNMLHPPFAIDEWRPALPELKDGGVWQSSPFADGRRLVYYRHENVIDTFNFKVFGPDQDDSIAAFKNLTKLLNESRDYWVKGGVAPVWIEMRGERETNIQYATIIDWRIPNTNNPFIAPFVNPTSSVIDELTLALEHEKWSSNPPSTDGTINSLELPISNQVSLYATKKRRGSAITTTSTGWDNWPVNFSFTVECWVYRDANNIQILISKSNFTSIGWFVEISSGKLHAKIFETTHAEKRSSSTIPVNTWTHIAVTYNDGTGVLRLFINGVEPSYDINVTGIEPYPADGAVDFSIFSTFGGGTLSHYIGWLRISKILRYTGNFTPPIRIAPPPWDANCIYADSGDPELNPRYSTSAPDVSGTVWSVASGTSEIVEDTDTEYTAGMQTGNGFIPILNAMNSHWLKGAISTDPKHNTDSVIFYDASTGEYISLIRAASQYPYALPTIAANDAIYIANPILFSESDKAAIWAYVFQFQPAGLATYGIADVEWWGGAAWAAIPDWDVQIDHGIYILTISRLDYITTEADQTIAGQKGKFLRVTFDVGATPVLVTAPYNPYQVIPYILGTEMFGDVHANMRLFGTCFRDQADGYSVNKIIIGTKSKSKRYFSSSVRSDVLDTDDWAPIGKKSQSVNASALYSINFNLDWNVIFSAEVNYTGKYRGFARIFGSAALGDFKITKITDGFFQTEIKQELIGTSISPQEGAVLDLGILDFSYLENWEWQNPFGLSIQVQNTTAGAKTIYWYDLILIPIDETYFELENKSNQIQYFEIDSITNPKMISAKMKYLTGMSQYLNLALPFPINFAEGIPIKYSLTGTLDTPVDDDQMIVCLMLSWNGTAGVYVSPGFQHLMLGGRYKANYLGMRGDA